MSTNIIEAIDAEIENLQQARAILTGTTSALINVNTSGRGRPKGSKKRSKGCTSKKSDECRRQS